MYRENARRDYLNLAKCKKRTAKKIRKAIKQQLQYVRRDMGYVEAFLADGVERLFFDAYNESDILIGAIERYRKRTSHYPERVLADKIYRNRANLSYCRLHGIRFPVLRLEGPERINRKTEYADNTDRVEVERSFSLAKRWYGLGRIVTKLDTTTRRSIALSILVMNVTRIAVRSLRQLLVALFSKCFWQDFLLFYEQKCHGDLLVA